MNDDITWQKYQMPLGCVNHSIITGGPGGTLGVFWWRCGAGTLEPLAYTTSSSAEFCYPILK